MSLHQLSPHDALFKRFMSDIEIARDFLDIHLPDNVKVNCNLNTLAMTSGSFIDHELRQYCSDMLYSLNTGSGIGYIYCLIEHQSSPDKLMAFRLHRYSIAAMHRHLEQGNDKLPLVIPLLFYHGKTSPYPYSMNWLDCFYDPILAQSIYSRDYPLVDITTVPDKDILTHRRVALLELVQKHIRSRDMLDIRISIADLVDRWKLPADLFRSLMYYIFERGNTSTPAILLNEIANKTQAHQEDLMTVAQYLRKQGFEMGIKQGHQGGYKQGIEKGMEQGLEQGIEQGIVKGERQAMVRIAMHLLAKGIDHATVSLLTGLHDNDIRSLIKN